MTLYIGSQKADIATDSLLLMNYRQTDATAPDAVYNSYSQEVKLPATYANSIIFDHLSKTDQSASNRFDALARNPFRIFNDMGEVVESGYVKLLSADRDGYTIQLYGGLGSFLFGLMYNPDGTKKTLADLTYSTALGFTITRNAVRQAWRTLAGLESVTKWNAINFAPCYNGLPSDFDANKAFCPDSASGVLSYDSDGGQSIQGHVLCNLGQSVDEWQAADLRSYLQRPVIRMKAIIEAICNSANNGGYSVNLDSTFFSDSNPRYSKLWLTLPLLGKKTISGEAGSGTSALPTMQPVPSAFDDTNNQMMQIVCAGTGKGATSRLSASLTFYPTLVSDSNENRLLTTWSENKDAHDMDTWVNKIVTLYQLVAYNGDGHAVGGSKIAFICTSVDSIDGGLPIDSLGVGQGFITTYNNAVTSERRYIPEFEPSGEVYDTIIGSTFNRQASGEYLLTDVSGNLMPITLDLDGAYDVSEVYLRQTTLAMTDRNGSKSGAVIIFVPDADSYTTDSIDGFGLSGNGSSLSMRFNYAANGARSGAAITQDILLGGTLTPADYLLSLCKMFGLYITCDRAAKTISIMQRNTFFVGGTPIDMTERIDKDSIKMLPYNIKSRWYDFEAKTDGAFASLYLDKYGKTYGCQRVNTGYQFDADHTDAMQSVVFNGAAEVLMQSKYFVRLTQGGIFMPSVFLDGGQYVIWTANREQHSHDIATPTNDAVISYLNSSYAGYDVADNPKPQFCDADGKALDGSNVLLMLDTPLTAYPNLTLTDDNVLMDALNDGKPCWLLAQHMIAANQNYVIGAALPLPRFRRFLTGADRTAEHSLEYGLPQEIDNPDISVGDVGIYASRWQSYIEDVLSKDARIMTCKVDLRGMGNIGTELLRKFYYYGGRLWSLNAIKNYAVCRQLLTECEFIRINDTTNYTNGQR